MSRCALFENCNRVQHFFSIYGSEKPKPTEYVVIRLQRIVRVPFRCRHGFRCPAKSYLGRILFSPIDPNSPSGYRVAPIAEWRVCNARRGVVIAGEVISFILQPKKSCNGCNFTTPCRTWERINGVVELEIVCAAESWTLHLFIESVLNVQRLHAEDEFDLRS